jgi:hypothetical protein
VRFLLRTRKETKKPLLTSGNSGIRLGDFLFETFLIVPRIGQESGSQPNHRDISLSGW